MVDAGDRLPPTTELAHRILSAVGALRREVRRTAGVPWPEKNLTNAQVELLTVVRRRPGISVAEAADEMCLAANTVSTLVGQLTRLGELRRHQDEKDRRVARLTLAPEARARAAVWHDQRVDLMASVIDEYGPEARSRLVESGALLWELADRLRALRDVDAPERRG